MLNCHVRNGLGRKRQRKLAILGVQGGGFTGMDRRGVGSFGIILSRKLGHALAQLTFIIAICLAIICDVVPFAKGALRHGDKVQAENFSMIVGAATVGESSKVLVAAGRMELFLEAVHEWKR
eukprot:UN4346